LPTTGLRFFTVYGPWGRPDMALFLFTKSIFEGQPINVFNSKFVLAFFDIACWEIEEIECVELKTEIAADIDSILNSLLNQNIEGNSNSIKAKLPSEDKIITNEQLREILQDKQLSQSLKMKTLLKHVTTQKELSSYLRYLQLTSGIESGILDSILIKLPSPIDMQKSLYDLLTVQVLKRESVSKHYKDKLRYIDSVKMDIAIIIENISTLTIDEILYIIRFALIKLKGNVLYPIGHNKYNEKLNPYLKLVELDTPTISILNPQQNQLQILNTKDTMETNEKEKNQFKIITQEQLQEYSLHLTTAFLADNCDQDTFHTVSQCIGRSLMFGDKRISPLMLWEFDREFGSLGTRLSAANIEEVEDDADANVSAQNRPRLLT
jgi:hypothetical protein